MKTTHELKHKPLTDQVVVTACLSAVLALAGCDNKGPAEKAGQKIDQTVEKTGQKIEQMTDKAAEKIAGAKQSVINKSEAAEGYIDDSAITLKVKAALVNDPLLKAFQIGVVTENGVVKLSGTVDSEQSVGRAMAVAESQQHVKAVETELLVSADTL